MRLVYTCQQKQVGLVIYHNPYFFYSDESTAEVFDSQPRKKRDGVIFIHNFLHQFQLQHQHQSDAVNIVGNK